MRLRNFCYEAVKAINCVSVCSIACSTHFEMCYVYISERTHVRCVNSFIGTCAAVHSCVDRNPCKVSEALCGGRVSKTLQQMCEDEVTHMLP